MARVCSVPGCPVIHDGQSRCPTHELTAKRQHWADSRPYQTRGHRTFRNTVLTRDPICVLCNIAQATVADHHPRSRIELVNLGLNPNDPDCGRGLCKRCHDRETSTNQPGGWNKRTN